MPYVKTGDVAALLGVSDQAVRLWCRTGVLPARRPPGTRQWLIDEAEFRRWLGTDTVTETVDSMNAPYREARDDEEIAADFYEARQVGSKDESESQPRSDRAAG